MTSNKLHPCCRLSWLVAVVLMPACAPTTGSSPEESDASVKAERTDEPRPAQHPAEPATAPTAPTAPTAATAPKGTDEIPGRAQRDAILAAIRTAAEGRDYDELKSLMGAEFYVQMESDDPPTPSAAVEFFRRSPSRLDRLAALAKDCDQRVPTELLCPSSLVELDEYGNAERIMMTYHDGGWHWDAFIADDET